jgi:hypothetical protein
MATFFAILSTIGSALLLAAIGFGHFGAQWGVPLSTHFLTGLIAAITAAAAHCLVFGIFTGSGKDTRELVQDLHLDPEYAKRTKAFRKKTFPGAMYAILLLLLTSILGGAAPKSYFWALTHGVLAWVSFVYNLKTFWLEYRCIRENAAILADVNSRAGAVLSTQPPPPVSEVPLMDQATDPKEWGTHVYALGKFLSFLGYNVWLPYIYLRFTVGMGGAISLPLWPFLGGSLLLLLAGWYLRAKYYEYRPRHSAPA